MPLPWELDGQMFEMIANQDARNLIKCLLRCLSPSQIDVPSQSWSTPSARPSVHFHLFPSSPGYCHWYPQKVASLRLSVPELLGSWLHHLIMILQEGSGGKVGH